MNGWFSSVSRNEAIVTLVVCALLGLEAGQSLLLGFTVLFGLGAYPFAFYSALSLVGGCVLGAVLLVQGGISIPSRAEKRAIRGTLFGLVVGLVVVFLLSGPIVGLLGICGLGGLAVGRMFD